MTSVFSINPPAPAGAGIFLGGSRNPGVRKKRSPLATILSALKADLVRGKPSHWIVGAKHPYLPCGLKSGERDQRDRAGDTLHQGVTGAIAPASAVTDPFAVVITKGAGPGEY